MKHDIISRGANWFKKETNNPKKARKLAIYLKRQGHNKSIRKYGCKTWKLRKSFKEHARDKIKILKKNDIDQGNNQDKR